MTATVPEQPLSEDKPNGEAEPVLFSPEKEEIFAHWFEEGTPPTSTATPEQPVSDDKAVDNQPGFLPEKEKCLAPLLGESYDGLHEEYVAWVRINHPERCLSVDSRVSSNSGRNGMSSSPSQPSGSDLSDILVLPKPKEKLGRKKKASVNQKTVCLTDDIVLDGMKAEQQRKKEEELERIEKRRIREEKKAEKERLKKEREEKKKQKKLTKQVQKAGDDPEQPEGLFEFSLESDDDAACPKCSLWYDFKCTKLKSQRHLPASYVCDLCS